MQRMITVFFNWGSKLKESKVIILRQLLDLAGENLDNAEMVASFLGTRSIRLVSLFLMNLKSIFTAEESLMIKEYFSGASVPDELSCWSHTTSSTGEISQRSRMNQKKFIAVLIHI